MLIVVRGLARKVIRSSSAQLESFAKTLDEPYPTEVGKMAFLEGKTDFSRTFWNHVQNTLLGVFVRQHF